MRRTIVIGDLHGMYEETVELLERCGASVDDRIIFLGDMIDRGPDNDKCVDLVMSIEEKQAEQACILGNHEQTHLEHVEHVRVWGELPEMPKTHTATRAQLQKKHYDYFRGLPLYIKLPEHNAVCVHAGVFPDRTIEEQRPHHLLHIQMINPEILSDDHRREKTMWPSKVSDKDGWSFWTHHWKGPERVIFGHSVLDRPLVLPTAVGIDGGAVFGGQLHALILPSWEIVSVQSQRSFGKGSRGREGNAIKKYEIHAGVCTFS